MFALKTSTFLKTLALLSTTIQLYFSLISLKYKRRGWVTEDDASEMSSTVLTTETLPSDERLMATVGNGFVATRVYGDSVFISGVYNGRGRAPSHRARVPSTASVRMSVAEEATQTYSLDVRSGLFAHRLKGSRFIAEQFVYAHRRLENILVVEIKVQNLRPDPLEIALASQRGPESEDINFNAVPPHEMPSNTADTLNAEYGFINTTEAEGSEKVGVAVVWTKVPELITVPGETNTTFYFITAIVTSLNTIGYLESAFDCHKEATTIAKASGLQASHVEAWAELWQRSGLEVEGELSLAQTVHASLYYILSSVRSTWPYGLSPGSLSSNDYWGHSFWDTETWMYPSLLLLHPEIARSLLLYRFQRISAARENAKSHNLSGTMFPWESAFTGIPVCPEEVYSNFEIHVSGDIGFAVEQYWMMTHDRKWLRDVGIPLIKGIAEFWASRVTYDEAARDYVINHVMCPDEYHSNVNNSAFTNAVAKRNLEFASDVVPSAPASWRHIAQRLRIPFDAELRYHPEYDGYKDDVTVKQADVILLGYPLMFNMTRDVRRNDLVIYEGQTDPDGPAMTKAMFAIGWLEYGDDRSASASFRESYQNAREPFKVWTEYPSGDGAVNFITGMGGFLQAIIFGYGGFRLHPDDMRLNPKLPDGVTTLRVRGFHYRGNVLDLNIGLKTSEICARSSALESRLLVLRVVRSGDEKYLNRGRTVTFENGEVVIREIDKENAELTV